MNARMILFLVLALSFGPQVVWAQVDRLLGVESGVGIPEELTPAEASELIGTSSGISQVMTVDSTYGEATSQSAAAKFGSDTAQEYEILYYEPSEGLKHTCEVDAVPDACNKGIKVLPGFTFDFLYGSNGDPGFTFNGSTGVVSNLRTFKKFHGCGGDLVSISPATGTAFHLWNKDPLSTAPTATAVSGANRAMGVATFLDSDGDYGVQISCHLPTGFQDALYVVAWYRTTGTGNAILQVATKCYADDEADDAAFNSATAVTVAAGTSGRPNKSVLNSVNTSGCEADELMRVRVFRNRTHGSDTLTSTLEIEKVEFWGFSF